MADDKSFTSWKLTVMDAISCDVALNPQVDRLVAIRILFHVNEKSRKAHPSMERIAAQLGVSIDTVKRSVARLADKHKWLSRERPTRISEYTYQFNDEKVSGIIDAKQKRQESAQDSLKQRKEAAIERLRGGTAALSRGGKSLRDEVANGYGNEVAPVHSKHLQENYQNRTPTIGSEGERSSNTREDKPARSYAELTRGW